MTTASRLFRPICTTFEQMRRCVFATFSGMSQSACTPQSSLLLIILTTVPLCALTTHIHYFWGTNQNHQIQLRVEINKEEGSAILDFEGTGPEVRNNLNTPTPVVHSAVIYCMRAMLDNDIPLNAGCLVPLTSELCWPSICFVSYCLSQSRSRRTRFSSLPRPPQSALATS